MKILTRSLSGNDGVWLVELEATIRPALKAYSNVSGMKRLDRFSMPYTRHVVLKQDRNVSHEKSIVVFPAFASGEIRKVGSRPQSIAGGLGCTHVDALEDLEVGYDSVECDIEGESSDGEVGQNRF